MPLATLLIEIKGIVRMIDLSTLDLKESPHSIPSVTDMMPSHGLVGQCGYHETLVMSLALTMCCEIYFTLLCDSHTLAKNTRVDPLSPICRRNSYKIIGNSYFNHKRKLDNVKV